MSELADKIKAKIEEIDAKTDLLIEATTPEAIVAVQEEDENANAAADLQALEAEVGDILPALDALDAKVSAALAGAQPEADTARTPRSRR